MEITENKKKPSGCWWLSGCLITFISGALMLFFVIMIFSSEDKMDENRAEYAASMAEYEEAMKAYEADSANLKAQYQRIQAQIDFAQARNDSMQVALLEDSLSLYAEPEYVQRGAIGFNIASGFFLVFAIAMLIPLLIGLLLLYIYHRKKRKYLSNKDIIC